MLFAFSAIDAPLPSGTENFRKAKRKTHRRGRTFAEHSAEARFGGRLSQGEAENRLLWWDFRTVKRKSICGDHFRKAKRKSIFGGAFVWQSAEVFFYRDFRTAKHRSFFGKTFPRRSVEVFSAILSHGKAQKFDLRAGAMGGRKTQGRHKKGGGRGRKKRPSY